MLSRLFNRAHAASAFLAFERSLSDLFDVDRLELCRQRFVLLCCNCFFRSLLESVVVMAEEANRLQVLKYTVTLTA